ncbi:MAG: SIMPL domain-containing protein [Chloroflexi bacterium]|nr:SIMPL domain-containing protein [Chloroflexota bacterium]
MNKTIIAVIGIVALGLLALGCTETTTVLPPGQDSAGITVSGSGSAFGEPDVAVLTLGVEAEAPTVAEARSEAAEAMDATLQALKDGGVEEIDIQTTRFSINPRYDFRGDGPPRLTGFFVENQVTVKIREIDDTGDLIDAAAEAGGDLIRIQNLRFTIDDPSALEDEARIAAMEEAKSKGETLAAVAGVSLGAPRSISESGGFSPIAFREDLFALSAAADASTPIETGELEVRVQVQVVYALEQ